MNPDLPASASDSREPLPVRQAAAAPLNDVQAFQWALRERGPGLGFK